MARSRVVSPRAGGWRRWRGWVTAALLAACVDGPTSPGMFGELRIRPSYPDGDAPTALGLSVDSAKVRVVRESEPTIALIDTMVRYESDTASMGWVLSLRSQEEPVRVDVSIWDDGARVYAGEQGVVVREAAITESGAEAVVLSYVGPPIVQTVTVTPATWTLEAIGATTSFTAEARDRHDAVVATAIQWTSSDPAIATVNASTGVVTAVGNGTTTIQAAAGAAIGAAEIVVAQRAAAVRVTPESSTLAALGATQALQATVLDANGFVVAGASVTWTSSNDAVVHVDGTGTATAVAGGEATVTASSGGVNGTARVRVNPVANVASVTVSPASAALSAVGATTQFAAVARDAQNNVLAGVQVVWTSAADDVATIDATGLARATGHGSTTITATAGTIAGTASLSVDLTTTVAEVVVSPTAVTLTAVGATQQFTAEARDAAGVVVPGVLPTWNTERADVATVDPSTGLAVATGQGTTAIRAAVGAVRGSATLSVELTTSIASISVAPLDVTLTALGAAQQYTAIARDANGAVLPGVSFAWTSSAPGVATIGLTSGLATVAGHGTTTITATANGISGAATLTADLTTVVSAIVVLPANATLSSVGATQQFTAEARDASGAIVPGVTFAWSSEHEAVATVDAATGIATAVGHGSTEIVAAVGDVRGQATLAVHLEEQAVTVTVEPSSVTLTTLGSTQQFTAVARDASGTPLPGVEFEWTSSVTEVASIDASSGLATVTGGGSTTITASVNGRSGTATLTANLEAAVTSIVVSPASATLTALGATQQYTAIARDANGAVLPGVSFEWTSSSPGVATIGLASGLATVAGHGTTTITATANGISGAATLTADLTTVVSAIVVLPANATLASVGATQQFTAEARDANGSVLPGMTFAWRSSASAVATIDEASGLATVTGHGTTTIAATIGELQGTASLSVDLTRSIETIVVSPSETVLHSLGVTQQFTAEARDAAGAVVPGIPFTWSSSAGDVATIDAATGLATSTGNGSTTITARAAGVTGTASLTVEQKVARVEVTPASLTLDVGEKAQLTATAYDANGRTVDGQVFIWSIDNDIAHVSQAGLVKANLPGTATITATVNGVSGSAALTVRCGAALRTGALASIVIC